MWHHAATNQRSSRQGGRQAEPSLSLRRSNTKEEEDSHMRMPGFIVAALLLTVPTAALAARGIVTTDVSMRAGPGAGFPVVDRIPGGAHVNIHGCIRSNAWCDVSWDGDRG